MEPRNCYFASFNVGKIEIWRSELFEDKNSVITNIEDSVEEILETLEDSDDDYSDYGTENLQQAIIDLRTHGAYLDKEKRLDFFILNQPVWKNAEQLQKFNAQKDRLCH